MVLLKKGIKVFDTNSRNTFRNMNRQCITTWTKHLAGITISSVTERIKSSCNL